LDKKGLEKRVKISYNIERLIDKEDKYVKEEGKKEAKISY